MFHVGLAVGAGDRPGYHLPVPFFEGLRACAPTPRKPARSSASGTSSTPTASCSAGCATEVARVLRGKHKPIFAPHLDTGDHVVIVNAEKVVLTSGKADRKRVYRHSGYPGGIKSETYGELLARKPADAIRHTVKGMLPKGPLGRQMLTQAEGVRRPRPPPRGPVARAARSVSGEGSLRRHLMATPLTQTTGRRKQAIARARLRPGTGTITVNGRPFDAYFPTPAHRMVASEPLRVAEATERYDVDATIHGGGVSGQAGALRMAIARSLVELDPETRGDAQEGRPPHPRLAEEGEQEVRPQEGPQGAAVHQALIDRGADGAIEQPHPDVAVKFGTDGVRGVANIDLTASFALDLGRAAGACPRRLGSGRRWRHPPVDGRCSRRRSSPVWPARASSCTASVSCPRPSSPSRRPAGAASGR